ncbi:hypothetical protein NPIL_256991 [Nephila pilipes]|uniref:Uncharacterized protein n=1 Tax=Nephila pilipes TaxID=299642 RepID=A0A8X6NGN2_NEPPI|nr:hypothetical protein NPIL_256991 [Nephila pilipes]
MHKEEQELSIKIWAPTSSFMLSQQGSKHPDWSILLLPVRGFLHRGHLQQKPSSRILLFQLCWSKMLTTKMLLLTRVPKGCFPGPHVHTAHDKSSTLLRLISTDDQ